MQHNDFFVRFWGARGSLPTPGPQTLEFGGNTSCVEIRCGSHLLIIDAGSGIKNLGHILADDSHEDTTSVGCPFLSHCITRDVTSISGRATSKAL